MRKGFCKRNSLSERKDKGPGEPKNIPLQGCGPTPSLATPPPPVRLKDQVRLGACFLNQSTAHVCPGPWKVPEAIHSLTSVCVGRAGCRQSRVLLPVFTERDGDSASSSLQPRAGDLQALTACWCSAVCGCSFPNDARDP